MNLAGFRWYFCRRGFPRVLQEAPHCIKRPGHKQEVLSIKSDNGIIPQTKQFSEKPFQRLLRSCLRSNRVNLLFLIKDCFLVFHPNLTELTEGRN